MEERWRTEGPRVVLAGAAAGSGRGGGGAGMKEVRWDEREPRTVQQVWGEAMSDYDAASETGSGRVRVQSPAATHGRRRSFPPEPDDLPLPPPPPPPHQQQHHPSHSHSTIHTSHNPFNSTSSSHSHSHSYHASHPSHGSSSSSHVEGTTTSDSHPSAAHIHTAHSVSLPSQAHQARPHLPVRTSSKREVHETVRAGPEGEGVVRTGSMLERRPTLTEAPGGSPARAASGSARAERRRHQSHAGLIEVVADGHDEQERDEQDGRRRHQRRRTRSNGLADPLPGEEDRPAFFQQRETLPRYDASRGDPRLPSR
ncbi:hypothetical protein AAT19DRAFT_15520 [Rhodotorula toruloides]|nr:hypothetical protein AAT19DRAFT_15520 [Rhodotorula toruloides]